MHLPFSPGGVSPQEGLQDEEAEEAGAGEEARQKTRTPLGVNLEDEEPGVIQRKSRGECERRVM